MHSNTPDFTGRGFMSERGFKIKLGRINSPSGDQKFIRLAGYIRRGSGRFSRRSQTRIKTSKSRTPQYFQRRVIIKFHLVKMSAQGLSRQAQHLDYIARDSASKDAEAGRLFSAEDTDIDADDFKARSGQDPHQFRIIVSPEDSVHLADLDAFTRDLMKQMESDMGTRLDWVAASHFDTATPHTHIVLRGRRDDGRALIIPRRYIAHGLREQAERLVTLELGPMQVREASLRVAREVTQDRFTALDRSLISQSKDLIVDVRAGSISDENWTRRLDIARLKYLSRMGLARKLSSHQWELPKDLEKTLRDLGERGDILKIYHRALKNTYATNPHLGDVIYDPHSSGAGSVTGKLLKIGVRDDVNDKAYAIVDAVSGQPVYVPMGSAETIADLIKGDILRLTPSSYHPKPSDLTIEKIAHANQGIYSVAAHLKQDPSATRKFIQTHIRRLEALRRLGIVKRTADGSFEIPTDYGLKVERRARNDIAKQPMKTKVLAKGSLEQLSTSLGATWLDHEMINPETEISDNGFGKALKNALQLRRQYLSNIGILKPGQIMNETHLDILKGRDLADAANDIEKRLGKAFRALPSKGRINGCITDKVDRPSGSFAILERSKDFTLVPWRDVLEARRGAEISGVIKRGQVNWQFGRKRGVDIFD